MSPEARREAILEAVVPVLLERGPDLSTRQIAEAAGVAEGTLFRVFSDKRELLLGACWHAMRPERASEWLCPTDDPESLEETLRDLVTTLSDGAERMGRILSAARALGVPHGEPGHSPAHRPPVEFFEQANRQLVERIARRLEPHAEELSLPVERAAVLIRSLVHGHAHHGIASEGMPTTEEITQVLLSGLAGSDHADAGSR